MQPYYHLDMIKSGNLDTNQKLNYLKLYGKATKDWPVPKTAVEKQFALDMIIYQLTEANKFKVGTLIDLPDKAIRWMIKEV